MQLDPLLRVHPGSRNLAFVRKVSKALARVSPSLRLRLQKRNYQVIAANTVQDVLAGREAQLLKGYPPGTSFQDFDGYNDWISRKAVVSQASEDACHVALHELGHGVDCAYAPTKGLISGLTGFKKAYRADVRHLRARQRKKLNYFLRPGIYGRSETFAEAFAELHGAAYEPSFPVLKHFPRSARFVARYLSLA